jgi:hypothetical protein
LLAVFRCIIVGGSLELLGSSKINNAISISTTRTGILNLEHYYTKAMNDNEMQWDVGHE